MLIIPVGDLAQHMLAVICFYTQNGFVLYDDIARKPIPKVEKFSSTAVLDVNKTLPLTFTEQYSLAELTAEISTSCYAGVLMLQAMGRHIIIPCIAKVFSLWRLLDVFQPNCHALYLRHMIP